MQPSSRFLLAAMLAAALTAPALAAPAPPPLTPAPAPPAPAPLMATEDIGRAFAAYLRARFAAEHGAFAIASRDFLIALTADPDDPAVILQAMFAGVMSDAADTTPLARELPDSQIATLVLAGQDARAGNWDGAERRFAHLPSEGPMRILQPLLVAWSQQGAGRTDAALATLAAALHQLRANSIYALHAGLIADFAGRTADADRFYALARSAAGPSLRETRVIASWQARQGRRGVAEATIQSLSAPALALALPGLERAVADRVVTRPTDGIAETYLALAGALGQREASDYALLLLHLALEMRPDLTAARLAMADLEGQLGAPEAALATLAAVPANDPLAPVVMLRQAQLTGELGRTDQAAHLLETLARDHPQSPEPLQELGDLLRSKHRWTEAVAAYTRALARTPHPGPSNWRLYFNRGSAYDRAHDWKRAEADLKRAVELAPNQPLALNYLGYAWAEQAHDLDRAQQMLEKAVALAPNDGNIVDSLGWVLLRQGDGPGAVRELERAVEMEPEDPTINGHLGDAYWQIGRRLEAQHQWRRALDLGAEPDDVAKLEMKLRDAASGAVAVKTAAPADHSVQ